MRSVHLESVRDSKILSVKFCQKNHFFTNLSEKCEYVIRSEKSDKLLRHVLFFGTDRRCVSEMREEKKLISCAWHVCMTCVHGMRGKALVHIKNVAGPGVDVMIAIFLRFLPIFGENI
jgi:hypothetical protein